MPKQPASACLTLRPRLNASLSVCDRVAREINIQVLAPRLLALAQDINNLPMSDKFRRRVN
jgi:hypothetical protein